MGDCLYPVQAARDLQTSQHNEFTADDIPAEVSDGFAKLTASIEIEIQSAKAPPSPFH